MILAVQNDIQDGAHDGFWDVDFLGTLHFDHYVVYAARLHEALITFRIALIDQSARHELDGDCELVDSQTYMIVFSPRFFKKSWSSASG